MDAETTKILGEINGKLGSLAESYVQLNKAVNGNGRPGLLDRMTSLEVHHCEDVENLARIERELDERIDDVNTQYRSDMATAVSARKETTDSLKKNVDAILEVLPGLKTVKTGFWWIAGLVGLATFGLLWGIFTHTIEFVSK